MTKLVVGLGNPGEQYIGTRHNLGFHILEKYVTDSLPVEESINFWHAERKFKAEIGKKDDLILARPTTFMNNSGMAVAAIANFYKIAPADIIIIHDELDLPLGQIKTRIGGAAAGHHGVESIIDKLGTDKFVRIRLGIGNLKTQGGEHGQNAFVAEKYVLGEFGQGEKSKLKHLQKQAVAALKLVLKEGLASAQNQFN